VSHMITKHRFITNTLSTVIFRLISLVIGFFIIPVFVGKLGAELYGIWILSGILMGYFNLLQLGVPGGVIKYISECYAKKDFEKIEQVINSSLFLFVLLSIIIFSIVFFGAHIIVRIFNIGPQNIPLAINLLKIAAIFTLFYWPLSIFDSVLGAIIQFIPLNFVNGVEAVLKSCTVLILAILNVNILAIFIVFNSVSLISWIVKLLIAKSKLPMISIMPWRANYFTIREIFSFSFWVFIQQVIAMMVYQTDNIIIGIFLPVAFVTTYAVVTKLFYLVHQFTGMFYGVIWPTIFSASVLNDRRLIEKVIVKGAHYMSFIMLPVTALGIVVVEPFITLWMGEDYAKYAFWCQLLFIPWLIAPIGGVFGNVAIGIGRIKAINLWGIIGASINVIISIIAVRLIGFGGVIVGTISVSILTMPFKFPWFIKILNVDGKKIFLPVFKQISLSIMFIVFGLCIARVINFGNFAKIIIFSMLYLGLSYTALYKLGLEKHYQKEIKDIAKASICKVLNMKVGV